MSLDDLRTHGKSTIVDAINEIPKNIRERLKSSLKIVFALDRKFWPMLLERAAASFESSFAFDEAELVAETGVTLVDARHLINGATFVAAMLSSHGECTADVFVSTMLEHSIIDQEFRSQALDLATIATSKRSSLTEEFERGALRRAVLPSLREIETSVDVRFSMAETEGSKPRAVPVVLLMIDTDAEGQILWCQLSKSELRSMISKLEKTMERVEYAEKWIDSKNGA